MRIHSDSFEPGQPIPARYAAGAPDGFGGNRNPHLAWTGAPDGTQSFVLLCIDTGNTNTVFSIWDGNSFLGHWRISTDHLRTADEYFVWLSSMIALRKLDVSIDACIISSTVPRVVFNLRVLCNRYFDLRPLVVGKPDCLLPVQPRVDSGTVVGPDRLVNTLGAFDRHGPDLIVVDFGTATTFDVVDVDGAYIGGVTGPMIAGARSAAATARSAAGSTTRRPPATFR